MNNTAISMAEDYADYQKEGVVNENSVVKATAEAFMVESGIGLVDEATQQEFINRYVECDKIEMIVDTDQEKVLEFVKTDAEYYENGYMYKDIETTLMVLQAAGTTQPGSASASGQNYGIAASSTAYVTIRTTADPFVYEVKLNRVTAMYTRLSSATTNVNRLNYGASITNTTDWNASGDSTVNNPASGTTYSLTINSNWYTLGQHKVNVAVSVYYANGQSSTYTASSNIIW